MKNSYGYEAGQTEYYAGVMSGTSFDGVDAVLCAIGEGDLTVLSHVYVPYDDKLRKELFKLQDGLGDDELRQSKLVAIKVSDYCVDALRELIALPEAKGLPISAAGVHGQTVRHNPKEGYTVQLADWGRIAEATNLDIVGDFRSQDIALHGQGAPLVPAFHKELFRHEGEVRAVLNIGGIANLTILEPDGQVSGFDTGPGNTLLDQYTMLKWNEPFDRDGLIAQRGKLIEPLLKKLLQHPYFARKAPKSTGRDEFPLGWLLPLVDEDAKNEDVLRTLVELTATTIRDALLRQAPETSLVIGCGGGCRNEFLMERIKALLPKVSVQESTTFGIGVNLVEAACMAWYAYRNVHHMPTDLRKVTGQRRPCIIGARWFAS